MRSFNRSLSLLNPCAAEVLYKVLLSVSIWVMLSLQNTAKMSKPLTAWPACLRAQEFCF